MFRLVAPVTRGRAGWMAVGLVGGMLAATPALAQQPPAQQPPAQPPAQPAGQAQAAPQTRTFNNDGGMILNFIKPDKTTDFENVVAKLKEALQKSEKPERKQQAQGWKVFKSPEPAAGGNILYIFIIDPSVKNADYSVANLLAEAFPPEQVNDLYKQYAGAYAQGQNIVNLVLVSDLAK
jgi:pyruvate/2-oxoglutarate dehydrogenase complex dihydrolipoamide acyltransferase (E2) component